MALSREERNEVEAAFGGEITMGPDRVLAISDYIQETGRSRPDLTALCKFGRSMQVRRLKSIAARNWNQSDWMNARAILDEVATLRGQLQSAPTALGLAVLGVESEQLADALGQLAKPLEDDAGETQVEPVEVEPAQSVVSEPPTRPERQSGRNNTRPGRQPGRN